MNDNRFVATWVGDGGWEVLENALRGADATAAATAAVAKCAGFALILSRSSCDVAVGEDSSSTADDVDVKYAEVGVTIDGVALTRTFSCSKLVWIVGYGGEDDTGGVAMTGIGCACCC